MLGTGEAVESWSKNANWLPFGGFNPIQSPPMAIPLLASAALLKLHCDPSGL